MSDTSTDQIQQSFTEAQTVAVETAPDLKAGMHFLMEKSDEESKSEEKEDSKETPKARNDLLEYMMRNDGSVVCKLCGEILQSRTHWYRHKYKLHVVSPLNPSPLFQCEQCLVYFKSRKGYIGHLASRHSEVLSDSSPVLTNSQAEASGSDKSASAISTASPAETQPEDKDLSDPEMSIPKTTMTKSQQPVQTAATVVKQAPAKTAEAKKISKVSKDPGTTTKVADWEEKRSREEKLVAEIIDRVRRECEAQGSGGAARRGYSRRYTVMHT